MKPLAASLTLITTFLFAPFVQAQGWTVNPYDRLNDRLDLEWAIDDALFSQHLRQQLAIENQLMRYEMDRMGEQERRELEEEREAREAVTSGLEEIREWNAMHRREMRREAMALAKQALKDVGLTQRRDLYLLRGEIVERRRTDPEKFAQWTATTTPKQQFKELAQDVLRIVCTVGRPAECPTGH